MIKIEYNAKEKWEGKLFINISDKAWRESWKENFKTTQSKYWKEFGWKVSQRFFITLISQELQQNVGEDVGKKKPIIPIFFACPSIKPFWEEVRLAITHIFDIKETLTPVHF